jgi:hypothetical protein
MNTTTPTTGRRRLRGYSKAFRPHGGVGKRYLLDDIPAGLWVTIRTRAKREGVSMRALILQLLTDWVKRPEEVQS